MRSSPPAIGNRARIPGNRECPSSVIRKDLGLDYTAPDMFAGSILDLEPDTEYEARFEMMDPDGVRGAAVHTVRTRARGEPRGYANGRILHVYPPAWRGPKQEPAFTG